MAHRDWDDYTAAEQAEIIAESKKRKVPEAIIVFERAQDAKVDERIATQIGSEIGNLKDTRDNDNLLFNQECEFTKKRFKEAEVTTDEFERKISESGAIQETFGHIEDLEQCDKDRQGDVSNLKTENRKLKKDLAVCVASLKKHKTYQEDKLGDYSTKEQTETEAQRCVVLYNQKDGLSARVKTYTSNPATGGSAKEKLIFPGLEDSDTLMGAPHPAEGTVMYLKYGEYGKLVEQDLTYDAVGIGASGNKISMVYTGGATAGSEVVVVNGNDISIQVESGVSTAGQVKTAYDAVSAATDLATCTVSGTGSTAQTTATLALLTGGDRAGEDCSFTFPAALATGSQIKITVMKN